MPNNHRINMNINLFFPLRFSLNVVNCNVSKSINHSHRCAEFEQEEKSEFYVRVAPFPTEPVLTKSITGNKTSLGSI